MCCTWMFPIKFHYEVRGMNTVPRFPRVVLDSETFPFDQIPQFPIDHLAIQNFLYYPLVTIFVLLYFYFSSFFLCNVLDFRT
jgi:hypothetical protein